jgi:DNA transformation protein and related proteins
LSAAPDHAHIAELFVAFGPVSVRRMFSGAGIFAGGVMIGLVSRGVIYLKADATTIPAFEREGMGPFTYRTKSGPRALASYWRMPDRLYDDPDELAGWAKLAHAALNAVPAKKRRAAPRKVRVAGRRRKK